MNSHKCKNVGCRAIFRWPMQLLRHKKVCTGEAPQKKYRLDGEKYVCLKCDRSYTHQPNITRHIKTCNGKVKKTFNCPECSKSFEFKCKLDRHLKYHTSSTSKVCPKCKTSFRRIDHFESHLGKCNNHADDNDELFLPSFCDFETSMRSDDEQSFHEDQIVPSLEDDVLNEVTLELPEEQHTLNASEEQLNEGSNNIEQKERMKERERFYKERQRKSRNLENIIKTISSPVKKGVIKNMMEENSKTVNEILTYTQCNNVYEARVCQALLTELKQLNQSKKYCKFHERLYELFGDQLDEENFLRWIASKLKIRPTRFIESTKQWKSSNYKEKRGREGLSLESNQLIYDTWLENCITSTDGRNGRNMIQLSKRKYIEKYGQLENSVQIEEVKNKRGQIYFSANRMVLTCTVRNIQTKVKEKGLTVSLGKVMSLKPFFITYPTEKEMSLCLCKLCLNARMLFEPLQAKAKKDGESIENSISSFFFSSCPCPKSPNGFYQLKCLKGKCNNCKESQETLPLKCQNDEQTSVKVSQFDTLMVVFLDTLMVVSK